MSLATLHLHVHYNEWYKCIFEGVVEWDFKEYLWKDRIACEKSRGVQLSHQCATEVSKGATGHIHLSRKLEKFSNSIPVNMPMVIQPLVRRWANVLMSACPKIGPTLANSKNSISVIIQLPKIWLACQPLTNIGPMLEWCWHYVPNIGPMLGQVDIGTLAQRRTNGWQMVGPTLAHRRPNIGMFMGMADWALQILAILNIFGNWNLVFRHIYANCG